MDFDFTPDEDAFRAELRAFLDTELPECVQELGLDPTVEERVRRLVDKQTHAEIAEDRLRLTGLLS